jgi:hypothetical protein
MALVLQTLLGPPAKGRRRVRRYASHPAAHPGGATFGVGLLTSQAVERMTTELTHKLNVRLTAAEHAALKDAAADAGLSLSDYARRRVLGRVVIAATDAATIRELRRLGGLFKFAITEQQQPAAVPTIRRVLNEIGSLIDKLAQGR